MLNMPKRKITYPIGFNQYTDFEGTAVAFKAKIDAAMIKIAATNETAYVKFSIDQYNDGGCDIDFSVWRYETDEEQSAREAREKAEKAEHAIQEQLRQEARERHMYEALKAKFEGSKP